MKGPDKIPESQLNEVETGKIPEKEFRIMIMKMIQDLRKTMEKMQKMSTNDIEEQNNKQTEKNNKLEGINSRITEREEWINHLEDRMMEMKSS